MFGIGDKAKTVLHKIMHFALMRKCYVKLSVIMGAPHYRVTIQLHHYYIVNQTLTSSLLCLYICCVIVQYLLKLEDPKLKTACRNEISQTPLHLTAKHGHVK